MSNNTLFYFLHFSFYSPSCLSSPQMKLYCKGWIIHILKSCISVTITAARTCFTGIRDLVSHSSSETWTLYFSHISGLEMQRRMTNVKSNSICTLRAARSLGVLRELGQEVSSLETLIGERKPVSTKSFWTTVFQRDVIWPNVNFHSDCKWDVPDRRFCETFVKLHVPAPEVKTLQYLK